MRFWSFATATPSPATTAAAAVPVKQSNRPSTASGNATADVHLPGKSQRPLSAPDLPKNLLSKDMLAATFLSCCPTLSAVQCATRSLVDDIYGATLHSVAVSCDGNHVAVADSCGRVHIVTTSNATEICCIPAVGDDVVRYRYCVVESSLVSWYLVTFCDDDCRL